MHTHARVLCFGAFVVVLVLEEIEEPQMQHNKYADFHYLIVYFKQDHTMGWDASPSWLQACTPALWVETVIGIDKGPTHIVWAEPPLTTMRSNQLFTQINS